MRDSLASGEGLPSPSLFPVPLSEVSSPVTWLEGSFRDEFGVIIEGTQESWFQPGLVAEAWNSGALEVNKESMVRNSRSTSATQ